MLRGVMAAEPTADPRPYGAADTAFGLDLLGAWCRTEPGANLVFSPSVLASALGLAYLGARGSTATAMARVLRLPAVTGGASSGGAGSPGSTGSPGSALLAGLRARMAALRAANGPGVTLAASNEVWADPAFRTLRSYLNAAATGYDAGLGEVPFQADPGAAAARINQAVARDTRGQITRLVTPDMVAHAGWVLTAALYMDAAWATPFEASRTRPGTFTAAGGQRVAADYMTGNEYRVAGAGGWTGVSLPYRGGKVTMLALLPPAGSGDCALPAGAALRSITAGVTAPAATAASSRALVRLPKVTISSSTDASRVLAGLGMGVAFGPSADFTGLSPQASAIAFVRQAATLKVSEKGTVAAAAAAGGMGASGIIASREVDFNRPYLLLVTDTATGEPLFLAKVANPARS